jgi:hypothetical protein
MGVETAPFFCLCLFPCVIVQLVIELVGMVGLYKLLDLGRVIIVRACSLACLSTFFLPSVSVLHCSQCERMVKRRICATCGFPLLSLESHLGLHQPPCLFIANFRFLPRSFCACLRRPRIYFLWCTAPRSRALRDIKRSSCHVLYVFSLRWLVKESPFV